MNEAFNLGDEYAITVNSQTQAELNVEMLNFYYVNVINRI